jgi:beta-N-acetylhexosaminidase
VRHANRRILLAAAAGALLAAALVALEGPGPSTPVAGSAVSTVDALRPGKRSERPAEPKPVHAPGDVPCAAASEALTTRQQLAQLVMVGVPGNAEAASKIVREHQVGGVFAHASPVKLLANGGLAKVRGAARIPLTVAIDEEGGRVQTIDPLAGSMPSARRMAATMTPEQVKAKAADRGRFLHEAGVTMNFAPVVDVTGKPARTVIGDRSFSADPRTAKQYAAAFAAGLSSAGVFPVLKHFPGHGSADSDSHKQSAVTSPLAQLEAVDLVPYRGLADYGPVAVMLGHLVVPGLTGQEPATLSPAAYQLLRTRFQFDGLAVTDDLGAMRAVTDRYDLPEAVLRAIAAGADVALWSSGARIGEVLDRLEKAVRSGELPAERVRDALRHVLISKNLCTS